MSPGVRRAWKSPAGVRASCHTPEAACREQFRRRVDKGACFSQPFPGTREGSASFTKQTDRVPISHSEDLGVMLRRQHRLHRWRGNLPLVPCPPRVRHVAERGIGTGRSRRTPARRQLTLLTRLAEHARHRSDLPPPFYRKRTVRWVIRIARDGALYPVLGGYAGAGVYPAAGAGGPVEAGGAAPGYPRPAAYRPQSAALNDGMSPNFG